MAVAIDFDAVMSAGQAPRPHSYGRPRHAAAAMSPAPVELSCLVLTGDAARRRRLAAAAELVGWETVESPHTADSFKAACRHDHRLVVLDLASPPEEDRDALEAMATELASRPDTLIVVCGSADDRSHEVWARSLGAFVFVPGIAVGDPLVAVFREARNVSERLRPSAVVRSSLPSTRMAFARN